MAVKFINITKDEFLKKSYLHKYLPLERALWTLDNSKIWFANPMTWIDPFERRFIGAQYENSKGHRTPYSWKDRVFCCCMTETTVCEAYWNVYSHQSIGIRFLLNRNRLLKEMDKISISNPHW